MAASLPWRRDEEPAQLPRLAPHSGGVGPKDHARGFYLWSNRIRAISTINAIRANRKLPCWWGTGLPQLPSSAAGGSPACADVGHDLCPPSARERSSTA